MGPLMRVALLMLIPGVLAFMLGVIAENKMPTDDSIRMVKLTNNITICHYPSDPSIGLGVASVVLLFVSTCIGLASLFYPYHGKQIPGAKLWGSKLFVVFFLITMAVYFVAEALLMWATIVESMHRIQNKHSAVIDSCPTAKTGLFGGAAFLALDTSLLWLVCLMLLSNAREDHFEEAEEKAIYTQIPGPNNKV